MIRHSNTKSGDQTDFRQQLDNFKAQFDCREVAERILGTPEYRHGRYIQYYAPDRDEKHPSLTVYSDGYYDFGNRANQGDVIDFVRHYLGLDWQGAIHYLSGDDGGIHTAPKVPRQRSRAGQTRRRRQQDTPAQPHAVWQKAAHQALADFQQMLWETETGRRVRRFLTHLGYTDTMLAETGIGLNIKPYPMRWKNEGGEPAFIPPGLVYPWYMDGQLVGLKVRRPYVNKRNKPDKLCALLHETPSPHKYSLVPGSQVRGAWYGDLGTDHQPLFIVEGEKDRDNLYAALGDLDGVRVAVITLGSAASKLPDYLLSKLRKRPWIGVVMDNDDAGQAATERMRQRLIDTCGEVPILTAQVPDPYNDISDWLLKGGDVAQWLGNIKQRALELSRTPDQMTYFRQGLPDTLRHILLTLHRINPQGRSYITDHAPAAVVMELRHEGIACGLVDSEAAATQSRLENVAFELGRACSTSTIRRGLEQLTHLGFFERLDPTTDQTTITPEKRVAPSAGDRFSTDLPPYKNNPTEKKGSKSGKNSGRPSVRYRPLPIEQALESLTGVIRGRIYESYFGREVPREMAPSWLQAAGLPPMEEWVDVVIAVNKASKPLYDAHADLRKRTQQRVDRTCRGIDNRLEVRRLLRDTSTPLLEGKSYRNGSAYRDLFYASQVSACGAMGRQISTSQAASMLGVTEKTLRTMRHRLNIVTQDVYRDFLLSPDEPVLNQIRRVAGWALHRNGRWLQSEGERTWLDPRHPAHAEAWAAERFARGKRVIFRVQMPSIERLVSAHEAEQVRRQRQEQDAEAKRLKSLPYSQEASERGGLNSHRNRPRRLEKVCPVRGYAREFVREQLELRLQYILPLIPEDSRVLDVLARLELLPRYAVKALSNPITAQEVLKEGLVVPVTVEEEDATPELLAGQVVHLSLSRLLADEMGEYRH